MKSLHILSVAFALLPGLLSAAPPPQGAAPPAGSAAPSAAPSIDQSLAAMAKYSEPGDQHKLLQLLVGTWVATSRTFMPSGQVLESVGSAEIKALHGGRYIEERYTNTFMNRPFTGSGLTGYDVRKGRYFNFWTDNFGTAGLYTEGTADPTGAILSLSGTTVDPTTGKELRTKSVTRIQGPDRHVFEIYDLINGKEIRVMEVVYTRKRS